MQRLHAGMVEVKVDFTHIFQGCFTIAPVIVKLPWKIGVNNPHEYTIRLWFNHNKTKLNKPDDIYYKHSKSFSPINQGSRGHFWLAAEMGLRYDTCSVAINNHKTKSIRTRKTCMLFIRLANLLIWLHICILWPIYDPFLYRSDS